ncbi:MAG TPA: transcription-repair coupling factor [Acidobacteriota bacterium]|nr:transcription-repair coupling factor [Acidobacteriota bacterium]
MSVNNKALFDLLAGGWRLPRLLDRRLRESGIARAVGDGRPAAVLLTASFFGLGWRKLLLVVPESRGLQECAAELRTMLDLMGQGGVAVATLPEPARSPADELPIHPRIGIARAEAAARLYGEGPAVLIVPAGALRWGIVAPARFRSMLVTLSDGTEVDRDGLGTELVRLGYVRRQLVAEPGEFALRGYVVDVYSPDRSLPVRAELIGDRIETLKLFNPADQRSQAPVNEYRIAPLRSMPLEAGEEAALRAGLKARDGIDDETRALRHETLHRGEEGPWLWLEPTARAAAAGFEEALPDGGLVLLAGTERIEGALKEQEIYWPHDATVAAGELLESLKRKPTVEVASLALGDGSDYLPTGIKTNVLTLKREEHFGRFVEEVRELGRGRITAAIAVMQSEGVARRLVDRLLDGGVRAMTAPDPPAVPEDVIEALSRGREGAVVVTAGSLREGMLIEEVGLRFYSHSDIYGELPKPARRQKSSSAFYTPLEDLKQGDFVVHIDHGIGLFDGLHTIRRGEEVLDVVRIIYRGGDRLLMPVDKLTLLQKYSVLESSEEGHKPRLDKLGGASWERVKSRVKSSIRKMAGELLNLYAVRNTVRGISHLPDDETVEEFERSFPHPETPDQLRAMEEIKSDMERSLPMDRLLCGDVGYGKTELALRAAIKAAAGGRQTALLAPTTVLAQQHFETFRRRIESGGFRFKVELLSRFRSPAEQRETVERLKSGDVDIVVGTHRLLSSDIGFRDLGLLIVDEEQRFGVTHKERIKRLRQRVDVLAMTATPIPRTLNMSLMGIRDISVIETPPRNRLAIHTEVMAFNPERVRQAVEAELAREGQVFYIHNRIERIEHVASMLRKLVPESRIAVAHAKMSPAALEGTMAAFVAGDYDLLVSTAIIENGLDIPRANTIIVDRADRFGLAQLYQLRGRVGRSDRLAYAFLLVPGPLAMSADARRRLEAIREFSELGSGFRIAAMDLEIRGAGNLLGAEQSGHIEAIGFELYNRLLEKTVREMRGRGGESDEEDFETTMNLKLDLHIPEDYISDAGGRMRVYRRVAGASSEEELVALEEELRDVFGPVPPSVDVLMHFAGLKLLASELKIEKIEREGGSLAVKFSRDSKISPESLAELVAMRPKARFSKTGVLFWRVGDSSPTAVLDEISKLLHSLAG